jgi:hypothetical protein
LSVRVLWPAVVVVLVAVPDAGGDPRCGTRPGLERELRALHDHARVRERPRAARGGRPDADVGDVAILVDRGALVVRRNPFDLDGTGVRLTPSRDGGYDSARVALPVETPGTTLGTDEQEAHEIELPFAFPFFGATYRRAFVHADGHVIFAAGPDPGPPGLARFLDGGPRIAPFFADFDPSRGGAIAVRTEGARVVILWSEIPGAAQINRNTFQLALHADGGIDMTWAGMQTREGIVGITPGRSGGTPAVDWSEGARSPGPRAMLERFSETEHADLVAATRRFLAGRADVFHQVIFYTTRPLNPFPGTLAFEINVRNDVRGIGVELVDHSEAWGSAGTLESVVYMDSVDTYAESDAFEFLAHEVGHRWLARLHADVPGAGPRSGLVGRGGVHWSFFLDTDASVMEGNAIADRGNGRFETVDVARRFSALDQYAMGLRLAAEVPPFFFVDEPDDFRPNRPYKSSSAPEAGISFTGVRRDVTIGDVVRAMGPRVPPLGPPVFRQAFVLIADDDAPATETRVGTLARIRSRFGPYFSEATGGRGVTSSALR